MVDISGQRRPQTRRSEQENPCAIRTYFDTNPPMHRPPSQRVTRQTRRSSSRGANRASKSVKLLKRRRLTVSIRCKTLNRANGDPPYRSNIIRRQSAPPFPPLLVKLACQHFKVQSRSVMLCTATPNTATVPSRINQWIKRL